MMCVTDNSTNLFRNTPEHRVICASRLDFVENGRWHPTPRRPAKSVAGLCDTQAAGTLWHSMGPPQKPVNGAPALLGVCNLHYNMCSEAVGKALTVAQHFVQDATGH